MSRIYFHTQDETAAVSGRERGLIGQLCSKSLLFALGDLEYQAGKKPWILDHIPPVCYLHQNSDIISIKCWLQVASGGEAKLELNGESFDLFNLQLNSAAVMGGNTLKLAARLHGQCEIHCYVEGTNRNWLATLIEDALNKAIFRKELGWEEAITLLRKSDDSPVVCSYSVCEQFPNAGVANWTPPKDEDGNDNHDAWFDLPNEEQWSLAMDGLRKHGGGLEMKPDEWDDFFFGSKPVSGFDFCNAPVLAPIQLHKPRQGKPHAPAALPSPLPPHPPARAFAIASSARE